MIGGRLLTGRLRRALQTQVKAAGLVIIAGALLGFLLLGVLLPRIPSARLRVHVDVYASAGSSISLYLNDLSIPPQVEPLSGGRRKTYTFPVPYDSITRIRVDLAEQAGVHIRLYSISVTDSRGRVVALYGPSDLATWARYFLSAPVPDPNALDVTSTAPGADVDAFRSVSDSSNLPGPLATLVNDSRNSGTRLELALWGSAIVAGVALALIRRTRVWLVAGVVIAVASMAALYESTLHSGALETPAVAVGRAAYFGFSVATNTHAVYAMYGLTAVVAFAIVVVGRRVSLRRRIAVGAPGVSPAVVDPVAANVPLPSPGFATRWGPWIVAVFSVVVMLAAFLPDLHSVVSSTKAEQYAPGWDTDNLLAWTAFVSRGLVPMKDFWYPYDNDLVFQSSLLGGPMLYFLYQSVGVGGYTWVLWRLSGRRIVLTCLAELGLVLAMPLIGEFPRYGFAFMISLVFCMVRATTGSRPRLWARLVLSFLVAVAAFVEADLLAYAAAGIFTVVLFECAGRLWTPRSDRPVRPGWQPWVAGLCGDLLGPAIVVTVALGVSAARGQLGSMISFYAHPGTLEAYSAEGSSLLSGLKSLPSLSVLLVWFPAVVLGGAILLRWGSRSGQALLTSVLAAVAGAGVPLLTKDAVRPLTADLTLVLVVALLAVAVAAIASLLDSVRMPASFATGLVAGLLVAALVSSGEVPVLTSGVGAAPANLAADVATLVHPSAADRAVQQQRFAPSHFVQYTAELAVAHAIKPLLKGSSSNLYVLGDAPVEYVLLDQRPPWEINAYNTSPVGDQRRVVTWIARHDPAVVVLDLQTGQSFDGVPNDVRTPLVYQQVIAGYEPKRALGEFDILRRIRRGEHPAARFWLAQLGNVLDLGAVPDAEPPVPPPTRGDAPTPVLQVGATAAAVPSSVSIPLRFGNTVVSVEFQTVPGRRTYQVPIDRLWPWALSHHVGLAGAASAGWSAAIRPGAMPASRLY